MGAAWGLSLAAVGAILGWSRTGYHSGFSDPKLLLILAGVMAALVWMRPTRRPARYAAPVGLYLASWLPSMAATKDIWRSLLGLPGIYTGGALSAALGAGGLLLGERLRGVERAHVRRAVLWGGCMAAAICLLQAGGADPYHFAMPKGRAVGLSGSPIDAGGLFVALLAVAPWSLVPVLLVGLLATASRGAFLGALVALLPVRRRIPAAAAAVLLGLAWVYANPAPSASDLGRRELWTVAARSASVLGTGPATFYETFEAGKSAAFANYHQAFAHNTVLEALSTRGAAGVLGLLAFLAAPRMAGLWVVAMFNPISFEVGFVACVLTGLYPTHEQREWS